MSRRCSHRRSARSVSACGSSTSIAGDQVPEGKKSLTFAVTMQAPDRALSEAEVTKVRDRVSQALAKRLKATLRLASRM